MSDRLKSIIDGLLRPLSRRVDYCALYGAKVISQNGDGTLELKPDTSRLPGLSKVPIRYGLPGFTAEVSAGARVLVGFADGDPQKPYAALWEPGNATLIHNGGTHKVARVGDHTAGHGHTVTFLLTAATVPVAGAFPVTGTITINSATDTINEGVETLKA